MAWIKAKNGNVFDVPEALVAGLVAQGHEAFESDPREKGAKPKRWAPRVEAVEDEGSGTPETS